MMTMLEAPGASTIQHARSLRPQPLGQQLRLKPQPLQEVFLGEGGQLQLPKQPGMPQRRPLARHVEDQVLEAALRAVLKRITQQGRWK
jgi:hypothetical protein